MNAEELYATRLESLLLSRILSSIYVTGFVITDPNRTRTEIHLIA